MSSNVNVLGENVVKKPALLRVIFISNALKILLAFTFYTVFTLKGSQIGAFGPEQILYTAIGYMFMFGGIVTSIIKRKIWLMRLFIVIDFAISIPTSAYIGFVISILSIVLSFTKPVKRYFNQ
ncbi:hypothetical protein [Sediminitomix flava]|uniref:Uncharacterized protein n=1 Tax=Sediminitomix flava TaxID=379075 RepID=A0A315Z7E2_SEDFL|nr:hypothetical protein [Sediminitomix flava]PWJ40767.1 hypothetical protein BC781_10425 [Sediminitomix flava]